MKYRLKHCIGLRLRRLSRVADGYMRNCVAEFGITENQMTILFLLTELGKVEQGKIGEVLVLQRSTVSRNINLLEKQNLVLKTTDYRPEVALSRKGKQLVNNLIPLWENAMDALIQIIKTDGMTNIKKLEDRLL